MQQGQIYNIMTVSWFVVDSRQRYIYLEAALTFLATTSFWKFAPVLPN